MHCLYRMEWRLRTVNGCTEVHPDPPKAQIRLYRQPAGRAFPADFRSRGRRRSPDRLTSAQTKLHQGLLRALPKDLRRAYLAVRQTARLHYPLCVVMRVIGLLRIDELRH